MLNEPVDKVALRIVVQLWAVSEIAQDMRIRRKVSPNRRPEFRNEIRRLEGFVIQDPDLMF
jgi:hypothetical protein